MKALFGVPKLRKDGSPAKTVTLPPLEDVHCTADPAIFADWVHYSALDAQSTWEVYGGEQRIGGSGGSLEAPGPLS